MFLRGVGIVGHKHGSEPGEKEVDLVKVAPKYEESRGDESIPV